MIIARVTTAVGREGDAYLLRLAVSSQLRGAVTCLSVDVSHVVCLWAHKPVNNHRTPDAALSRSRLAPSVCFVFIDADVQASCRPFT